MFSCQNLASSNYLHLNSETWRHRWSYNGTIY
uniref:Uncharacterized protein n=1 Tax=Rhizophora mucronata TaxID=61149 RepID=A0A2P2PEF2_RHIMU